MTMIASPNWFSILSAAFLLGGLCLAAKAALLDPTARLAERKVDLSLALPFLVLGGIFNLLGSVSTLSFNWVATSLMLALAYTLLLYLMMYDLAVDRFSAEQSTAGRSALKLAVVNSVAPQLPQPEAAQEPRSLVAPKEAAAQN